MITMEAAANAVIGLALSNALVHLLWPLFGWPVTGGQSVAVTAVFFVASFLRSYALRWCFAAWRGR